MQPWWNLFSNTLKRKKILLTPDFWMVVYTGLSVGQHIQDRKSNKKLGLNEVLMCIHLSAGPFWCRWAHHSERTGVQAGQWGSDRKSIHLRPHSRWRLPGKDLCFFSASLFLFLSPLLCLTLIFSLPSDTSDVWQGVHRGCWDEAGCTAGGWESQICCREGKKTSKCNGA